MWEIFDINIDMLLDEILYTQGFMIAYIVKHQQVLPFPVEFVKQSPKKVLEGHAILRIVKVVVKLVGAC